MKLTSPLYHRQPLKPEPQPMQPWINFFIMAVIVAVMAMQYLMYTDVVSLRETIHTMQLSASR